MFAHLEHPSAYRRHVAQVAKLGLPQSLGKALPCQPVLQTLEPFRKLIQLFYRIGHGSIVIERLQNVKLLFLTVELAMDAAKLTHFSIFLS